MGGDLKMVDLILLFKHEVILHVALAIVAASFFVLAEAKKIKRIARPEGERPQIINYTFDT